MSALEGVKILDLSRLAPGKFCIVLLGDLGAEAVAVEAPQIAAFVNSSTSPEGEANRRTVAYYAPIVTSEAWLST